MMKVDSFLNFVERLFGHMNSGVFGARIEVTV